jgi:ABC-2 type transport system permease protein
MVLLAALPVLVALLIRLGGGRSDAPEILDTLVIRTVLPLIALVFGTATIGSEIEDGTIVFLLAKPIARWRIALAKLAVAAGLTAALTVPPIIVTTLLVSGFGGESLSTGLGFALAAVAGGTAYAVAFGALGVVTSRALVVGLAYTLLWEGVLAGLLEGTRFMSIRQGTLGLAAALTGDDVGVDPLPPVVSVAILVIVVVGGFLLTARALTRFQVRSAD